MPGLFSRERAVVAPRPPPGGVSMTQADLAGVVVGAILSGLAHWPGVGGATRQVPVLSVWQPVAPQASHVDVVTRASPATLTPKHSPPPPRSPPPPSPAKGEARGGAVQPRPGGAQTLPSPSDLGLGPASYPAIREAVAYLTTSAMAPGIPVACHPRLHTDLGGDLAPGVTKQGESNTQPDAGACCASCQAAQPACNAWVWHNSTRACWLKHLALFPERPWAWYDANSPWTGGTLFDYGPAYSAPAAVQGTAAPATCLHTVLTSNGNSYMNWQTRVMYATWQAAAGAEAPEKRVMAAFTRVLHRGSDDELMTEVPTWRVDPLRPACDTYCDFPVADRAAALAEWAKSSDAERCSHVMMVETDYLFVRPIPAVALPGPGHAVGFHFGYIAPESPTAAPVCRRFLPTDLGARLGEVPQTGNAPQILTRADFGRMMPAWRDMHARVEADESAKKEFTWVRDMYSYSFAAATLGIQHHVPLVPYNHIMVQPPADVTLGLAAILHYTWGPIVSLNGTVLWKFDKREYGGGQGSEGPVALTKLPLPPPWQPGMRLQANETVTPDGLALMALLVDTFNAAVDSLPLLPKGYTTREAAVAAARPHRKEGV